MTKKQLSNPQIPKQDAYIVLHITNQTAGRSNHFEFLFCMYNHLLVLKLFSNVVTKHSTDEQSSKHNFIKSQVKSLCILSKVAILLLLQEWNKLYRSYFLFQYSVCSVSMYTQTIPGCNIWKYPIINYPIFQITFTKHKYTC